MGSSPAAQPITRDDLRQRGVRLLRSGRGTRPDVRLVATDRGRVVVKDYLACAPLFRLLIGRWLAAKESATYRRLSGLAGIPAWVATVDPYCFAIGFIGGRSCDEMQPGELSDPGFYRRLNALVERLHGAGVVHCDLRYRSNIVVAATGEPYLVDLVAAFSRKGCFGTIRRWLFTLFSQADFQAVAKLKAELSPELLTAADIELLSHVWPIERLARAARGAILALFGLLVRRPPKRRLRQPRRFERYRRPTALRARQQGLRIAGKR
jgi:hypothetical protein